MTVEAFGMQLDRLRSLRFVPADFSGHYEVLGEVPVAALEAGISRALRTRAEFPTPVELLDDVQAVRDDQPREAVVEDSRLVPLAEPITVTVLHTDRIIAITHAYQPHCEVCQDSGFAEYWCGAEETRSRPWLAIRWCSRSGPHDPHSWVQYCLCFATNPAVQARRRHEVKPREATRHR